MFTKDALAPALSQARALLAGETPLRFDCGRLCGAACCQADGEEPTGMLLFPTEAESYRDSPWARVIPSEWIVKNEPVPLLVCRGECPREERPLACRLFPLSLRVEEDRPQAVLDPRAWALCPLMDSGLGGLHPDFVGAVQGALDLLWQDPDQREYLRALDALLRELQSSPF